MLFLLFSQVLGTMMAQTAPASYPRVNLARCYSVDPNWPQRAPDVAWGQMPGVAVDREDNVWIFTRTNPAVQVYASDGRYCFGWDIAHTNTVAHFIRFDAQGNV